MADQLEFFATAPVLPDGFRYEPELITPDAERTLVEELRGLPFREFEFHGHVGRRRTVSFGWAYDFSREALVPAPDPPGFLLALRHTAASFAALPSEDLQQVLVTEYGARAGIGWHRDKAVFGQVIGVSLLSSCPFRFRRKAGPGWERVTIDAEARSAYLLSGPARMEWEHSIPPVGAPRYSITFRTLATRV